MSAYSEVAPTSQIRNLNVRNHLVHRASWSRCQNDGVTRWRPALFPNPLFPALRSGPSAAPGAARQKQIPSSLTLVAGTSNAFGALMSLDWQTSGDGAITVDTSTGLYWLDLTETRNTTIAEVESGFSDIYSGFRYATNQC